MPTDQTDGESATIKGNELLLPAAAGKISKHSGKEEMSGYWVAVAGKG